MMQNWATHWKARFSVNLLPHASSKNVTGKVKASKMDTALDISEITLSVLSDAARWTPVPYLQEAAHLALGILAIIQGVRGNKSSFQALASDVCGLVYTVLGTMKEQTEDGKDISPGLVDHLQELLKTLNTINTFVKTQATRNLFMLIVSYKSDVGKIQEYRERLRQALDIFGLQSNITIRETVARIAKQQEVLLKELQLHGERKNEEGQSSSRKKTPVDPSPSPLTPLLPWGTHAFSNISSHHGTFMKIAGDQSISTITHNNNSTNSGNTMTITTTNSNNDSSVINVQRAGRGSRKYASQ